jgi:hypothetical protein
MDLVGTLAILVDLTWTSKIFLNSSGADPGTLRAARLAKLGAKAGRLAKLTKIFRFMNLSAKKEVAPTSAISATMEVLLSQRVAILIMTIVIINPFLTPTITDFSGTGFLLTMDEVAATNTFTAQDWLTAVDKFGDFYLSQGEEGEGLSIVQPVWLKIRNISVADCPVDALSQSFDHAGDVDVVWDTGNNGDGDGVCRFDFQRKRGIIRAQNQRFASSRDHGKYSGGARCSASVPEFAYVCTRLERVDALFDNTNVAILESWLSLGAICVVVVLLVTFTATFHYAVADVVVKPISRIMSKLKKTVEKALRSVKQIDIAEEADDKTDDGDALMSGADDLEELVNKLARLVQKSLGNKHMQDLLAQTGRPLDANATAWLNSHYSFGSTHSSSFSTPAPLRPQLSNLQSKIVFLGSMKHASRLSTMATDLPVSESVVDSFEMDVLSLDGDQLFPIVRYMFDRAGMTYAFGIKPGLLASFINKVREGYLSKPSYHNWHHGCDVMHGVFMMLRLTEAREYLSKAEEFALFIAALAHDIGHLGVPNSFLVKTGHSLARMYNDTSPLENMHASVLSGILRDPSTNITMNLSEIQRDDCRRQILKCILSTDMVNHKEHVSDLAVFEEVHGDSIGQFLGNLGKQGRNETSSNINEMPECLRDPKNRLFLQETFLHAADLSNPLKKFSAYEKWVARITDEFCAQGDKEVELGMAVSPMCDRKNINIPSMQLGFIRFIILPFFSPMFKLFPRGLAPLGTNLHLNFQCYATKSIEEAPDQVELVTADAKNVETTLRESFGAHFRETAERSREGTGASSSESNTERCVGWVD